MLRGKRDKTINVNKYLIASDKHLAADSITFISYFIYDSAVN